MARTDAIHATAARLKFARDALTDARYDTSLTPAQRRQLQVTYDNARQAHAQAVEAATSTRPHFA